MDDWGGLIGLDFAHKHPERVKRLVIANTWCWPVWDDFHFKSFSFLISSLDRPVPAAASQHLREPSDAESGRRPKRPDAGDHGPLPQRTAVARGTGRERRAAGLNRGRERLAALDLAGPRRLHGQAGAHSLGPKDIAFRSKELERLKSALRGVEVQEFEDSGHFPAEEAPGEW